MSKIVTFKVLTSKEGTAEISCEFGRREIRKPLPPGELIRLAAMLNDDAELVDVEIVVQKQ